MRSSLFSKWILVLSFLLTLTLLLCACDMGSVFPPVNDDVESDTNKENPDNNQEEKPTYEVISIERALELCGEEGNITTERYYIRGTVATVTNTEYGAMVITDGTFSIPVYGTYSEDGSLPYTELKYQPVKGDEVLLHCILQNYGGTKEVKNARLIEYTNNQGNIDISDYFPSSVADARTVAKGELLLVEGVVARITYSTGMKPNGYMLVDKTGSIYVYDSDSAQRVVVGNKVKIAAEKDFWILDKEMSGAEKFGYMGCNQLTNAYLISNDNKTNEIDTSWVQQTTVKDILETPVSENITTNIYKVNALVKKVVGTGFTNYYFFDLDGETGSYTYTQCNGEDFAWLDEFDNKICTVYLTALNAKCSSTGCVFRFLPVAVYDEGFVFDTANAPAHALKYYALDQFLSLYTGNPELEVMTSLSSSLLGFDGVEISYSSSDTSVVNFTENNGKLIFECLSSGTATVTITATYMSESEVGTVNIQVVNPEDFDYVDVNTAISANLNDTVTVRGIVGPSLVNRDGFYLIDESGLIAVIVNDNAMFSQIAIGNEVILTGKRDLFHNGKGTHAGQIALTGAVLEANLYGSHEYDDTNFVSGKTVADFYALDVTEDYSTTVFVLKATVVLEESTYSTKMKLVDGSSYITLYCSGAGQYSFLNQFIGQEVTLEVAACNWNNKTYYAGCVLSVITEDGKVVNSLNFDTK